MSSQDFKESRLWLCCQLFCLFLLFVSQTNAQPIPGSVEDGGENSQTTPTTPTPFPPIIPTPSPTPIVKSCPKGWQEVTVKNGTKVCIQPFCLSSPRYWLFVVGCYQGVPSNYPLCYCQDGCAVKPVYEMEIRQYSNTYYSLINPGMSRTRTLVEGSYPYCLRQIAAQCGNRWSTEWNAYGTAGIYSSRGVFYIDLFGSRQGYYGSLPESQYVFEYDVEKGTDECVVSKIGGDNNASSMTVFLDSNCNSISQPRYTCGLKGTVFHDSYSLLSFVSPVSLILDERRSIGTAINVVQFPLGNKNTARWYAWKASAETPLIVYDPEHKGEITEPSQLFGNYTFGKTWKHGYEALATLDIDQDGKVFGEELKDLGLWFDRNQDGISQFGEVQDIREFGITALYAKLDSEVKSGEDIYVTHGFDRVLDGKSLSGASVDWFVAEYESRDEGLIKEQARAAKVGKAGKENELVAQAPAEKLKNNDSLAVSKTGKLSGSWMWKTAESIIDGKTLKLGKNENPPMGMLTLVEKDGKLSGHSFVEIMKPNNQAGVKSEVLIFALSGTTTIDKDSHTKLEFSVKGENGLETISKAELSSDGRLLLGQSTMQIGHKHDGQPVLVDYYWKGEKVD